MARHARAGVAAVAVLVMGCSEWPRFANPPTADVVPAEGAFRLQTLDEEGIDRPDDPTGLGEQRPALLEWYRYVSFTGTLEPDGNVDDDAATEWPPCRAGSPGALPFDHGSNDVDWLPIRLAAMPTCIALSFSNAECRDAGQPNECLWDAILFEYDSASGCTTGPFLNPADDDAPDKPELARASWYIYLDRGPDSPPDPDRGTRPTAAVHAIALSGASSSGGSPTAYEVRVAHAPTLDACIELAQVLEDEAPDAPGDE